MEVLHIEIWLFLLDDENVRLLKQIKSNRVHFQYSISNTFPFPVGVIIILILLSRERLLSLLQQAIKA